MAASALVAPLQVRQPSQGSQPSQWRCTATRRRGPHSERAHDRATARRHASLLARYVESGASFMTDEPWQSTIGVISNADTERFFAPPILPARSCVSVRPAAIIMVYMFIYAHMLMNCNSIAAACKLPCYFPCMRTCLPTMKVTQLTFHTTDLH